MYAGRLLTARRQTAVRQQRGVPQSQSASRDPERAKSKRVRSAGSKARIREEERRWKNLTRLLCNRSLITAINMIVFLSLSWNTTVLIRGFFVAREERISSTLRSYLAAFSAPQSELLPGSSKLRHASFRDKYPSTTLSHSGTFDAVYVISNSKCSHWEEFKHRAMMADLTVTRWPLLDWRSVSLESPPVRISQELRERINPRKPSAIKRLKRQLVYMDAHRRIWEAVANKSVQRSLIIDETIFPSKRLLASLPPMMTNIDTESIAQQKAWHIVQFRLVRAWAHKREAWCMNPVYHHAVVRANASLGAGMYALSLHGARYLRQRINEFRAPLDIELGLLQVEDREFVALSGCNNDRVRPFCPEMVDMVQGQESMECLWQRFWETRNVDTFKKLVRA